MTAIGVAVGLLVIGGFFTTVTAMQFSSSDYIIDTATLNNVGGFSSSTNYQLTSSGGEAAIGNGAGGSYKMAAGYVAQIITPAITVDTQPSGLIGYYPMDENSGSVVHDQSSNTYLGSFNGAPSWVSGRIGSALSFNGSSQVVSFSDASQAVLTNGTVELWVKTSQTAGNAVIAGKYGAWELGMVAGKPSLYNFATSASCTSSSSVADGSWHHIVATLKTGVTNGSLIYIDGVQSQTCTWSPNNQSGLVAFGARYDGSTYSNYLNGTIDQVKVFSRALSADEITAEYQAQSSGVETGLSLSTVVPGVSNSTGFDVVTLTSGSSYTLSISQNHDLQNGSYTIPPIGGSIAAPAAWNEGTTKDLGFTLSSTNATAIPAKWNTGSSYAALPNTPTSFYTRSGQQSSGKDILGVNLRLDTTKSQASGAYSNQMTVIGTANP